MADKEEHTNASDKRWTDSCHRREGACDSCAAPPPAGRPESPPWLWLLTTPSMADPRCGRAAARCCAEWKEKKCREDLAKTTETEMHPVAFQCQSRSVSGPVPSPGQVSQSQGPGSDRLVGSQGDRHSHWQSKHEAALLLARHCEQPDARGQQQMQPTDRLLLYPMVPSPSLAHAHRGGHWSARATEANRGRARPD